MDGEQIKRCGAHTVSDNLLDDEDSTWKSSLPGIFEEKASCGVVIAYLISSANILLALRKDLAHALVTWLEPIAS